jgi:hypothetical protein
MNTKKSSPAETVSSERLLGVYGGYMLARSNGRGGKAGTGHNKTAIIQVRETMPDGYLLKAQYRYQLDDSRGEHKAVMKARAWVDAQMPNGESSGGGQRQ